MLKYLSYNIYSFGQKAIFLLGSQTLLTTPVAMYIESGDVCIMSAKSRLAYHAVPRIINENNSCSYLLDRYLCDCGNIISNFDHPCCEYCRLDNRHTFKNPSNNNFITKDQLMESSSSVTETTKSKVINSIQKFSYSNQDDMQTLWMSFHDYLLGGRINMNVRQVLQTNGTFPLKVSSVS